MGYRERVAPQGRSSDGRRHREGAAAAAELHSRGGQASGSNSDHKMEHRERAARSCGHEAVGLGGSSDDGQIAWPWRAGERIKFR